MISDKPRTRFRVAHAARVLVSAARQNEFFFVKHPPKVHEVWSPSPAPGALPGDKSRPPQCFLSLSLRAAVAGLLIAHFLVIAAMEASPAFHEWIHQDADHDDHDCAVTLFAHGSVDASAPPVLAVQFVQVEVSDSVPVRTEHVPCCHLLGSLLEHAPPLIS